jgi:hypothetical protein
VLTSVADDDQRTGVFGWYNVAIDTGHAVGALAGALPALIGARFQVEPIRAHQVAFVACAIAMAASAACYAALSRRVEIAADQTDVPRPAMSPETRRAVTRLTLLFGLDSLGGGFLSSALIAYWFFQRFGASEVALAGLFFVARSLNAAGHLGAAWIARRIGLVNTMVFTHLPSSLFIMAAPAAPSLGLASVLFLCREALVEMDVPTRQSYVMAIVAPHERSVVSGITNLTRTIGWAVGPSIAGAVMQVAPAGPLVIGGLLKVSYDALLYGSFRGVPAPEERARVRRRR